VALTSHSQGARQRRWPLIALSLLLGALALPLAGCGSDSSTAETETENAAALLQQTFGGAHRIGSGVINTTITAKPSGSAIINTPLTLTIAGPFDDSAGSSVPALDLTAKFAGLSMGGSMRFITTGTAGYVSLADRSYKLPAKEFAQLRDGLAASAMVPASGLATAATSPPAQIDSDLAREWRSWLLDPRVVDSESVNGVRSDHIAGRLDVTTLLRDLRKLAKRRKLGAAERARLESVRDLSDAEIARIAAEVGTPSFEIWAGKKDHVLRRTLLSFHLQLNGSFASVKSAAVTLSTVYSDVNEPQQIVAPTTLAPFSQFEREVSPILDEVLGSSPFAPQTHSRPAKPSATAARAKAAKAKAARAKAVQTKRTKAKAAQAKARAK
jgi:hypothetical protein